MDEALIQNTLSGLFGKKVRYSYRTSTENVVVVNVYNAEIIDSVGIIKTAALLVKAEFWVDVKRCKDRYIVTISNATNAQADNVIDAAQTLALTQNLSNVHAAGISTVLIIGDRW